MLNDAWNSLDQISCLSSEHNLVTVAGSLIHSISRYESYQSSKSVHRSRLRYTSLIFLELSMILAQRMQKPSEMMQEPHWSSIDIASLAVEGGLRYAPAQTFSAYLLLEYIGQQERMIMKWQEENHRLREELDRLREEVKRLRE